MVILPSPLLWLIYIEVKYEQSLSFAYFLKRNKHMKALTTGGHTTSHQDKHMHLWQTVRKITANEATPIKNLTEPNSSLVYLSFLPWLHSPA
jgi:hypothetical protein